MKRLAEELAEIEKPEVHPDEKKMKIIMMSYTHHTLQDFQKDSRKLYHPLRLELPTKQKELYSV